MPPVAGNNFSPVIQHLNNLKDLLDTLSAKLGGVGTEKPTVNVPGNNSVVTPTKNNGGLTSAGNNGAVTPSKNNGGLTSAGNNGAAASPVNNAYTFFGLTKNSTSNNLEKSRRNKIKEYHADKHIQNNPENQEKFKGLYSQVQPKYEHLKAIFDARNAVANAANGTVGNANPDASAPVVAAIDNAKKATMLAIKNGSVENVSKATGAANAAAAAAVATNNLGNNPLNKINVTAMQPNKTLGEPGFVKQQKNKINAKTGGRRSRRRSHKRRGHTRKH
jgi:hypothetical protein